MKRDFQIVIMGRVNIHAPIKDSTYSTLVIRLVIDCFVANENRRKGPN